MSPTPFLHRFTAYRLGLAAHPFAANPYPPHTFDAALWDFARRRGAGLCRGATQ